MRRAFSEPSIGSMTTLVPEPVAEDDLAALLGDRGEVRAGVVEPLELGERDLLGVAVEDEAAVTAFADPRVYGPGLDPASTVEELTLAGDDPAAGPEPVVRARLAPIAAIRYAAS